jgi:N-acetylmuramoyl-L-alanine amidase
VGQTYTVKQGDFLAKIAHQHGFGDWKTIYNHAQNTGLRSKRPNPNILSPGDVVYIPDKKVKHTGHATAKKHKFVVKKEKILIRIAAKDAKCDPLALNKFELALDGQVYSKTQAQDANLQKGIIEQKVSSSVDEGRLRLWTTAKADPDFVFKVLVGHLDPIEELSGVQARLNHLGFDCGRVDGTDGPGTQQAVRTFQQQFGHRVTGSVDQATRDKLKAVHGC